MISPREDVMQNDRRGPYMDGSIPLPDAALCKLHVRSTYRVLVHDNTKQTLHGSITEGRDVTTGVPIAQCTAKISISPLSIYLAVLSIEVGRPVIGYAA